MLNKNQTSSQDTLAIRKKYAKLIWEKKFIISVITLLVTIGWIFVYTFFISKAAEISTSAVIRFDDPRSRRVNAVADFITMSNVSKVAIVKSNSFLNKVVDSLNLNVIIETSGVQSTSFFKDIKLEGNPEYGLYKLSTYKDNIRFYYSNKKRGIKEKLIFMTSAKEDSTVQFKMNGLNLAILSSSFNEQKNISFSFIPDRVAIEILKSSIETGLDQTQTLLTITYSHQDPQFSSHVTNTIANMYILQLLEFNRYQTSSIIESLEKQLKVAQKELMNSENELRKFREQNPFVFLASDGQRVVSDLANYEANQNQLSQEIQDLTSRVEGIKRNDDFETELLNYQELLAFLQANNVPGSNTFMIQYEQYGQEIRQLLTQNYAPTHPQIVTLKSRIQDIEIQIDKLARQYLESLNSTLERTRQNISNFQTNLQRLPRSQLRLAELQRNRQIKENIVSSIMSRYNEAKVADAAVIPDAFIIDEAQPPLTDDSIIDTILMYGLGVFLGLILGIGLVIYLDLSDNTVKTRREFELKINLPVLTIIPVIGEEDKVPERAENKDKMDKKLITSDYAPNIAGESFRLLRTKIMMDSKNQHKSLIIASINAGEGKSLVSSNLAITIAQQKLPTVLIDCDLRRGVVHHSFACDKKPGLSDILSGNTEIKVENISDKIQKTHIPNLFIIPSGTQIPNPSELLGSERMEALIGILQNEFKIVLFDTPPVEYIPDALILNNFVHKILMVVRFGKTDMNLLNEKLNELADIRDDLTGFVINASHEAIEKKYYSYSYYPY